MTPKRPQKEAEKQEDLFKVKLEDLIDPEHELVRLADYIPWDKLDHEYGLLYHENIGRPGHPTRLMSGLHFLKETHKVSDEVLMYTWRENPYWQYFCGMKYFEHKVPVDPTTLGKWRKRIGADRIEKMLSATVEAAEKMKLLKASSYKKINADTTVQEKAVRYPTDSRLYHDMRETLVAMAKSKGIKLRQSYRLLSKKALRQISGYIHAKQMKRARSKIKKLKTWLGCVVRDITRKIEGNKELQTLFAPQLDMADRLLAQQKNSKNKIYSIHAPEVECIGKGKVHKRYEFGVKAGVVTTSKEGVALAVQAHHNNPYDGHTLAADISMAERICGRNLDGDIYVDRGYRGHNYEGDANVTIVNHIKKQFKKSKKKWMKRRSAIEPEIGHMKSDGHLSRNFLAGEIGDKINALLCGCGHNMRKMLAHLRARPLLAAGR